MLGGMTYKHLNEWWVIRQTDPFSDERADWRIAKLAALIAELQRNPKKRRTPYQPHEFLLDFKPKQQQQLKKMSGRQIFDAFLTAASDAAMMKAVNRRGKRRSGDSDAERVARLAAQIEFAKTQRKPKKKKD